MYYTWTQKPWPQRPMVVLESSRNMIGLLRRDFLHNNNFRFRHWLRRTLPVEGERMAGKFPLAEAVEDAALMEADLRPIMMDLKKKYRVT